MERGYIHIYTGNGKGKTTAAFGLAVRALCAGKKVYIGQFVKSMKYNETRIEELFGRAGAGFGQIRIERSAAAATSTDSPMPRTSRRPARGSHVAPGCCTAAITTW